MKFRLETLTVDGENCAVLVGENEQGIATVADFKFEPKQTLRITEVPEPPMQKCAPTFWEGFFPKNWL